MIKGKAFFNTSTLSWYNSYLMKSSYHSITFGNSVNHNYAGRYLWRKIYYLLSLNLSGIHVYNCELLEFEKCSVLKKNWFNVLTLGCQHRFESAPKAGVIRDRNWHNFWVILHNFVLTSELLVNS